MHAAALLSDLKEHGLTLALYGKRLTVSPASALTDAARALIREHKAELLALLAANEPETGIPYATAEQLADTRRTCRQCRNLAGNGRCLAAGRGELPLTQREYRPDPDRLERCVGYQPTADDADQRPGRERFPGLYRRLWAMQEGTR